MAKVYDTATDLITFARLQAQNTTSGSSYLGSDGLLKFAAEDEPRIEYAADGSLKGLLIEEQRTNLIQYSEDFTQSYWTKSASGTGSTPVVTASSLTDPAGGTGAYQVEFDAGAGTTASDLSIISTAQASFSAGSYTNSIWVRGDVGGEQIVLRGVENGPTFALPTLTTEWQRVIFTETRSTTGTVPLLYFGIRQSVGGHGVINSSATVHIYGAQLEQGSFATSYIPTSGSQSTRSPDIASIPVSAFGYNQDAGTVVVEASRLAAISGDYNSILSIWTDSSNRIDLGTLNDDGYQLIRDDGIDTALYNEGAQHNRDAYGSGVTSTVGLAFKLNSANAAVNGTIGAEDTSCTIPTVTQVKIGNDFASRYLNGHIKSLSYFPRRLTNAQLQELTS